MFIWAGIFDLSDNGYDIGDASALLGFVALLTGIIFAVLRYTSRQIRDIVRDEIGEATKPIQPAANGGFSLPDVAKTSDWNKQALKVIAAAHGIELPPDPHERVAEGTRSRSTDEEE
jgi:hypothetical protein